MVWVIAYSFFNIGPTRLLSSFSQTNTVSRLLGIQTRGGRMVGTDESFEQWRRQFFVSFSKLRMPNFTLSQGTSWVCFNSNKRIILGTYKSRFKWGKVVKLDCCDGGGGQGVGELAFYSDDPSSNSAEVYNFKLRKNYLKKNERM